MTNLMRWLAYVGLFCIPYFGLLLNKSGSRILTKWMFEIRIFPIILVILFGVYSATTVLYRTLTVKNCPEAEKELQEQILEARKDLTSKGFKFRD